MSVISNLMSCGGFREPVVNCIDKKNLDFGLNWRAAFYRTRISMPFEGKSSRWNKEKRSIRMALVDEKVVYGRDTAERPAVLAYELVQGSPVKWGSVMGKSKPDPPTAVLLHGILGSRKNWGTFTRRLAQEFPTWQVLFFFFLLFSLSCIFSITPKKVLEWCQHSNFSLTFSCELLMLSNNAHVLGRSIFLLVDLRCHGDSASIKKKAPHTVASTAFDVLKLVSDF
ncbi:hypothetical protein SADUNF_Sadunf19G0079500 [Salix dunnii]|uniref:AB hydrolase-1 domain-containing protein n=1 Tax=Salix dunnii TaxID=1413687 RepID=A0A835J2C0_9ROSI|nr:hypothetical protein SADUNF_Sadunf19G0079500 [Salix dunnii]